MHKRLVISALTLLVTIILLEVLLVQFLSLDDRWAIFNNPFVGYLLLVPAALLLVVILLPIGWLLRRWLLRSSMHMSVRAKLMWALGLLTTLPVVLLGIIAYTVMSSSIEEWTDERTAVALEEAAKASSQIDEYHIDLMATYAQLFAIDPILLRRLAANRSIRSHADKLAREELDGYEMGVYDKHGRRAYGTDPLFVPSRLDDLGLTMETLQEMGAFSQDIGGTSAITGAWDVADYGLLFSLMPVFSDLSPTHAFLGAVVIIHPSPFTHTERSALREKGQRIQQRMSEGKINYRDILTGKPQVQGYLILGLVLAAVVILGIAVWVSSYQSQSINKPIHALMRGTERVAHGDLDHEVHVENEDEFAVLAESFNQMTRDLKRAAEERKRAEELAVWRDIARKIAHEIKNPLTPIQLSAQRLQRRYRTNPEGFEDLLDQCTNTIVREVESARRWLDEFSQLGRMPMPQPEPIDVCAILEESLDAVPDWPPGVQCERNWPEDGLHIHADGEQLRRAFFNLIKNALESMNGEGALTVRAIAEAEADAVRIEVQDTGPGVPPEVLPKLFVPHFSTKRDGMGLGLANVKRIIDDHQGRIEVDTGVGKPGTCFVITLPKRMT